MDREDKIDLIAAMYMVRANGKLRAVDALVCAEVVLGEIEIERIFKELRGEDEEPLPLSLVPPITFKPQ